MLRAIALPAQRSVVQRGGALSAGVVGSSSSMMMTRLSLPMAPVSVVQRRHNVLPDGSTYHPRGHRVAAQAMPMTEKLATECNQLAKAAHQTRNFKDAVNLYERVLKYRRDMQGATHVDCAKTLHNLGRVHLEAKDYPKAESCFAEACALYENKYGNRDLHYADSLGMLGAVYRDMQRLTEAEGCFRDALLIFREHEYNHGANSWLPDDKTPPPRPNEHPLSAVAHILADTGSLFISTNQTERAAAFLEEALEIRRFLYSTNTKFKPMIAQTLAKLSEVRRFQGDISQAEITINECLDICIECMGRDSPATAHAMSSKGNCLAVRQKFREAKKLYEEAATTYAIAFGKQSPLVASELIHIGRAQEVLKEFNEAEQSFLKALEITNEALGKDHVQVADASQFYASVLMKKQEYDKAIPLLRDAVRIRCIYNKNDPALVFVYHRLGDALAAKRDPEAEAYFLQAVEIHKHLNTDTQLLMMTDVLDDLGLHYMQFKHYDRALETFTEGLKIRIAQLGEVHPTIAYSYSNLAVLNLARENFKECETSAKMALSVYEKVSNQESWLAVADVQTTLGQAFYAQKMYKEAVECHEKALNARKIKGTDSEIMVAESLHFVAKCKIELKELTDAASALTQAFAILDRYPTSANELRAEMIKTRTAFPTPQIEGAPNRGSVRVG